jgi:hypothetical protein
MKVARYAVPEMERERVCPGGRSKTVESASNAALCAQAFIDFL